MHGKDYLKNNQSMKIGFWHIKQKKKRRKKKKKKSYIIFRTKLKFDKKSTNFFEK
jgi:hypothetical protein